MGKKVAEIAAKVGIEAVNPEGWLFPDTYAFTAGTKDIALLKRAHINMKQQLNVLWQKGLKTYLIKHLIKR